jgi:hypothetical protein
LVHYSASGIIGIFVRLLYVRLPFASSSAESKIAIRAALLTSQATCLRIVSHAA